MRVEEIFGLRFIFQLRNSRILCVLSSGRQAGILWTQWYKVISSCAYTLTQRTAINNNKKIESKSKFFDYVQSNWRWNVCMRARHMRICIQITLQDWDLNIVCDISHGRHTGLPHWESERERKGAHRTVIFRSRILSLCSFFSIELLFWYFLHILLFLSISQRCVVIDLFIIIDDDDFVVGVCFFRYFCRQKLMIQTVTVFIFMRVCVYFCVENYGIGMRTREFFVFLLIFGVCYRSA